MFMIYDWNRVEGVMGIYHSSATLCNKLLRMASSSLNDQTYFGNKKLPLSRRIL